MMGIRAHQLAIWTQAPAHVIDAARGLEIRRGTVHKTDVVAFLNRRTGKSVSVVAHTLIDKVDDQICHRLNVLAA